MTAHEPPIRRSIEVEYWVIDEEGRLVEPGALLDAAPGAEREFVKPLLELKTTPCASAAELRDDLCSQLRAVLRRADDLGKGLVPLATPLCQAAVEERPCDRTRIQNDVIGPAFEYVRHCAGTHIHVEQQPAAAIDQLNTLVALDPALALVNSARHFRGEPLSPGARSELYRRRAYAGLDHQGRLWPYVTDRAEWEARLDRRYEEFSARATEAGVDPAAVEAAFDPESAVWTPVQLRETFGTVEWRSPDATLPSDILRLAETVVELVGQATDAEVRIGGETGRVGDREVVLPTFEALQEYVDAAIEDGVAAEPVEDYLDRMGFDVDAYEPLAGEFDDTGTVTPAEARQLRLEYADRLRADVARTPVEAD